MPTVAHAGNVRVVIYANDHPPPHVHAVRRDEAGARLALTARTVRSRCSINPASGGQKSLISAKPWRRTCRGYATNGGAFMAEFEIPTQHEFDAATRRGTRRLLHSLLAVSARYDRRGERVIITLNNGMIVGFPRAVLPGLEHAHPDQLRTITVEAGGYGLHVAALDADISVPRLLEKQLGSTTMKMAQARAAASRANGRLGGRPRKPHAAA